MDELQKQYAALPCYTKIEPIRPVNDEFTLCKVYVQGIGQNRNYSYMSKENVERAEPTIHYIPVVGHLMTKYDEDGNEVGKYFGGHDYVWDENWNLKAQTVPFGVVTNDAVGYEIVREYGQDVEYMTATAVLWTGRYPELKEAIYADDCWFAQSMEISIEQSRPYGEDSNYTELLDWTYSALCILGKSDDPDYHTEPCFISSRFVPMTYSADREQFNNDMSEMRERLAFILSPKEGGETPMDMEKIESILAEYGLAADAVDFDYAEMDEDALREAAKQYAEERAESNDESADEPAEDEQSDNEKFSEEPAAPEADDADSQPAEDGGDQSEAFVCEFAATYGQRREVLQNTMDGGKTVTDQHGNTVESTYYWLVDFDDTYAYVTRYVWRRDGDCIEDRGRLAYSFSEADLTASVTGEFEPMYLMWLTEDERQKLEASRNVFEELKQYKAENEKAKRKVEVDELFAQFEDLQSVEGFGDLQAAAYESGELEDIETKLFAMRGRQVKCFAKVVQKTAPAMRVGIETTKDGEDVIPYGGLLRKH